MKISFCSDAGMVKEVKRDHAKDYPHQTTWGWRDGFVVVCLASAGEYRNAVRSCGTLNRFKAFVHKRLLDALPGLGASCPMSSAK